MCATITASAMIDTTRESAHAELAAAMIARVFFSSGIQEGPNMQMCASASCLYSDFRTHAAPSHAVLYECQQVYTRGTGGNIRCIVYDADLFHRLNVFKSSETWVDFVLSDVRPENGRNRIATICSKNASDISIEVNEMIAYSTIYGKLTTIRKINGDYGSNAQRAVHPDAIVMRRMISQLTSLSHFSNSMMNAMLAVHPCVAAAYFRESGIATAVQPFGSMANFQRSKDRGVDTGALPCEGAPDANGDGRYKIMSCGRHVVPSLTMNEEHCPLCDSRRWCNAALNALCGIVVQTTPTTRRSVLIATDDACVERSLRCALTTALNLECNPTLLSNMDSLVERRFDIIAFIGSDESGIYKTLARLLRCIDSGVEIVSIETPRAGAS